MKTDRREFLCQVGAAIGLAGVSLPSADVLAETADEPLKAVLTVHKEELRRRVSAIPTEVYYWQTRARTILDMDVHFSQIEAVKILMDVFKDGQADLINGLQPAGGLTEYLDQSSELVNQILRSQFVWDFFRSKLQLRFDPSYKDSLWLADTIAFDCYRDTMEKAVTAGIIQRDDFREPPLCYFTSEFSPATWVRGSYPEGLRRPRRGEYRTPIPVIELPWDHAETPWDFLTLAHEVGHDLESDLALRDELLQALEAELRAAGAPNDRVDVWKDWQAETFADLVALQLVGPAYTDTLMRLLLLPAKEVTSYDKDDPHPTHYVRILMNTTYIRTLIPDGPAAAAQRDVVARHADRIDAAWRATYGDPEPLRKFQADFPAVFRALMDFETAGSEAENSPRAHPLHRRQRRDDPQRGRLPEVGPEPAEPAPATVLRRRRTAGGERRGRGGRPERQPQEGRRAHGGADPSQRPVRPSLGQQQRPSQAVHFRVRGQALSPARCAATKGSTPMPFRELCLDFSPSPRREGAYHVLLGRTEKDLFEERAEDVGSFLVPGGLWRREGERRGPDGGIRGVPPPECGPRLWDALPEAVRRAILSPPGPEGALVLRIKISSGSHVPYELPWEWLTDGAGPPFALRPAYRLARWVPRRLAPPPQAVSKLRVMVVASAPDVKVGYDTREEIEIARSAIREAGFEALFSVPIMLPLSRALAEHQPHVLHFIGHAALSRGEGCLVCEDERKLSDWVTPSRLAGMLPPSVGLLCLSSPSEVRNYQILGFPRLAQSSSALSLPSMVANQYQVNRDRSTRFWKAFYKALAHTQCDLIEAAWRAGQPDAANAVVPDLPAFALYLRDPVGRPFDFRPGQPSANPAQRKALEIEAALRAKLTNQLADQLRQSGGVMPQSQISHFIQEKTRAEEAAKKLETPRE